MNVQLTASRHAQQRMQGRGIPALVVELLLTHGEEKRTDDGFVRYFDKKSRRRLERAIGGRRMFAMIEPFLNVYAVEGDNGNLVTVGHRFDRIKTN